MRYQKIVPIACCALMLLVASNALAQGPIDRLTYLTFSGPVQVPGKTLAAGKYTFRLADPMGNRNVVQILSDDRKMIATLLTISEHGTEISDDPYVTFKETPENMPPALRTWFYPGTRTGWEFVYPREQALRIARASGESVLSSDEKMDDVESMKSAEVTRVEPDGRETPLAEEEYGYAADGDQADETAQAAGQRQMPVPPTEAETQTASRELPGTASLAPLVGSGGVASLFGALALGLLRRRSG